MQANFLFTTFASAIENGRRRYWGILNVLHRTQTVKFSQFLRTKRKSLTARNTALSAK